MLWKAPWAEEKKPECLEEIAFISIMLVNLQLVGKERKKKIYFVKHVKLDFWEFGMCRADILSIRLV